MAVGHTTKGVGRWTPGAVEGMGRLGRALFWGAVRPGARGHSRAILGLRAVDAGVIGSVDATA